MTTITESVSLYPSARRLPAWRRKARTALAVALLAAYTGAAAAADTPAANQPVPVDWEKFATPKADRIVVHKALRQMDLLRGDVVLKTYHVALGHHPVGQKIAAGDGRTPEGTYFIDRRKMASDYHLALHISYPDDFDLRRAAARGVPAGGEIMIHGEPGYMTPAERKRLAKDWTAGCIALTNPEIDEVWRLVDDGVTIDIYP